MSGGPGCVYLVGAGPGALDLVTLRARELISIADVIVYDYLCNPEMLRWARVEAEQIYAGKMAGAHTLSQEEINALLVGRAQGGARVVRLKGGDPYVFGRGGEEAQALVKEGISFEVVPGITSAIAAPAYAGIPVTHRDFASTVTFVTGHEDPARSNSAIDWPALAQLRGTKIFLMGVERLGAITECLIKHGASPDTPVAVVRWGTTPRQETLEGTLLDIAAEVERNGFRAPAVTVVGAVVRLRRELSWFESLPLLGWRVVVTRTRLQSSGLAAKLARLGADVLEIPTIQIAPLALEAAQQTKLTRMREHFDWLVFTSPNAVDHFFAEFFKTNEDLRELAGIDLAVVGPATGRKLTELHLKVALTPKTFTAADLARAFTLEMAKGKRFCIPKGKLAPSTLAEHLQKLGAWVEEWVVYHTQPAHGEITPVRERYLKEGAHAIVFASSSAVENWQALDLSPAAGAPTPAVVSMGPATSEALRIFKYEVAAQAVEATIEGVLEAVKSLRSDSDREI